MRKTPVRRFLALKLGYLPLVAVAVSAQPASPVISSGISSFEDVQAVFKTYCYSCHQGRTPAGKLDLTRFHTLDSAIEARQTFDHLITRVRSGEMPPRGVPAPTIELRNQMVAWLDAALRKATCAAGPAPGPALTRRLNREEYSATMRDLLNIHISAGHALPADGAGGEGFDNAAETLFLSPIHAEKYLEAARQALDYAAKDPASRGAFLIAEPGPGTTPEQAARKILEAFLPRAFRRPAPVDELERYLALFRAGQARKESFEESILYALQGVLISPSFLFLVEHPNATPPPRPLGDYELASRLSYFLWGTMPDKTLLDLAADGKLHDPDVLKAQAERMIRPPAQRPGAKPKAAADQKVHEFAQRFVEQWLGTRELGRDIKPDPKLFPKYYDSDTQTAIRDEPVAFFQEILSSNLSLLNLLDSKFAMVNDPLAKLYGLNLGKLDKQMLKHDLPEDSHRGGLLGMAAIAVVSSYPTRTSPVLRGKWVLDSLLGTPPPPPPPNVPALLEASAGASPKSLRERLVLHRQDPACASCHASIDPIGFGLENYDVLGRWRSADAGQSIDTKGELPDGTVFNGPEELKAILLARKDVFIRHLTAKMLGYALGRGLTAEDSCTVDDIVAQLQSHEYQSHTLIEGIIMSAPFRLVAGSPPAKAVKAAVH